MDAAEVKAVEAIRSGNESGLTDYMNLLSSKGEASGTFFIHDGTVTNPMVFAGNYIGSDEDFKIKNRFNCGSMPVHTVTSEKRIMKTGEFVRRVGNDGKPKLHLLLATWQQGNGMIGYSACVDGDYDGGVGENGAEPVPRPTLKFY